MTSLVLVLGQIVLAMSAQPVTEARLRGCSDRRRLIARAGLQAEALRAPAAGRMHLRRDVIPSTRRSR